MDATERRNAANGYVWAYRHLKDGRMTIEEVRTLLTGNPMEDWRQGAEVAIADYLQERDDVEAADSEGGDCD